MTDVRKLIKDYRNYCIKMGLRGSRRGRNEWIKNRMEECV